MFHFSALFRSHIFLRYSTAAVHRSPPNLISDYLTHTLQFSKQEALTISSKANLTHLKNPNLIIKTFQNYGFTLTQIKQIISCSPKILSCKPNTTLEPKIKVFYNLGLSGSDLVNLIKKNPDIFGYGLHTRIIPCIDMLRGLMGSDEKVIKVINKSRWLYMTSYKLKRLFDNVSVLREFGVSNERIVKFVLTYPDRIMVNRKVMEMRMSYVERKLGISRNVPNFIHALSVVLYCSDTLVERKMRVFERFGWSGYEIATLVKAQPNCLKLSENYISDKLEFFMRELNYDAKYLMGCTSFWTLSLEKRVKPRNEIFKILKEKELVRDTSPLITILQYNEPKFLGYLKSFESHVPTLCETYMNSIKNLKAERFSSLQCLEHKREIFDDNVELFTKKVRFLIAVLVHETL